MDLPLLLDMVASGFGSRVLYGSAADQAITASELRDRARAGAHAVREAGAGSVVYLAGNGPAFPVALFAAATAGVPLLPLNYRLSADRLAGQLAASPSALLIADEEFARQQRRRDAITPAQWLARTAVTVPGDVGPAPDPDGIAILLYTSGTTATPKTAVMRHRHLTSYVLSTVEFGAATEDEASLVSVPPYHIAGVSNTISNLYAGRRVVQLPDFSPARWLGLIRRERITSALVVPTMLARVVEHLAGAQADVPTLRSLAYGGAPMPASVIERALRAFPGTGFVNAYGLTETSSTIALLGPDDHRGAAASEIPAQRDRLRSAGKLVPGVEAQIRALDGTVLGPSEPGQLWVRGAQVSGEYLGQDGRAGTDGWFHTRDEAYLDDDGYLFVLGRTDDTIIRGGENVAPAEVEDALRTHPAVADAAVVGVPDEEWGQRIAAAVVRRPHHDVTRAELREHVRAALRSARSPDDVVFVDTLPYNDTGKLARRLLASTVLAGLERGSDRPGRPERETS